ncbi:MAG: 2-C-methyl-D-erythritol 2,4-cyclodiphosphate synthase [Oscillospiraceae bacterium]
MEARNLDATVIARDQLAPYIDTMRKRIADALETDAETSASRRRPKSLGFAGSGEGIAAHACA